MAENSEKIDRWNNCGGSHRKYFPVDKEIPPMVIAYHNKTMGRGICSKVLNWMKVVGILTILLLILMVSISIL